MLRPNTILGNRYQIIRQIGEGGMGAVYLARDSRLGNFVALKQTFYSDAQMLRAFEREAQLLSRLRHRALPSRHAYYGGPTMTSNSTLLVYAQGTEMVLLDVASRNSVVSVSADRKHVKTAAISRDGKFAVSGGSDGTVKIWDLSSYAK